MVERDTDDAAASKTYADEEGVDREGGRKRPKISSRETCNFEDAVNIHDAHKKYTIDEREVGEGTFGRVYRGKVKDTGEIVAIKQIKLSGARYQDGMHPTALREIKFLKELSLIAHKNVIKLFDIYSHRKRLYLVFEFCDITLEDVVKDKKVQLPQADIKSYMKMLLEGVDFCHKSWILHRDLKPNNLMLGKDNQLKLIDFGAAKTYASPGRHYNCDNVTLWYRSPELLFGCPLHTPGIDMWSIGCIFGELLLRRPLIDGQREIDQLGRIFRFLGTPKEKDWPNMKSLSGYIEFEHVDKVPMKSVFGRHATSAALDLLELFFKFDPAKRISAGKALEHKYFKEEAPRATKPDNLIAVRSFRHEPDRGNLLREQPGPTTIPTGALAKRLAF